MYGVEEAIREHGTDRLRTFLHRPERRRCGEAGSRACSSEDHSARRSCADLAVRGEHIVQRQRKPHPLAPRTLCRPAQAGKRRQAVVDGRHRQPFLGKRLRDGMRLGLIETTPEEPSAVKPEQSRSRGCRILRCVPTHGDSVTRVCVSAGQAPRGVSRAHDIQPRACASESLPPCANPGTVGCRAVRVIRTSRILGSSRRSRSDGRRGRSGRGRRHSRSRRWCRACGRCRRGMRRRCGA